MTETSDTLWDQRWFLRLSPDLKALYFYLDTGTRSITGIYARTIEEMWFKTRIDQQVIKMGLELGELRNIRFDLDHEVVYILDKFDRNKRFGGDPARIDTAIMNEHKDSLEAKSLWADWVASHKDRVDSSPALSVHFTDLDNPVFPSKIKTPRGARRATKENEHELETEITSLLVRYNTLGADEKAAFFRVYRALTTAASGRLVSAAKRVEVLQRLDRYDIDQVGIGAEMFEDAKGLKKATKPLAYLIGTIEKGALSAKVERDNERAKERRGER